MVGSGYGASYVGAHSKKGPLVRSRVCALTSRANALLALLAVLVLTGCGNAYESISIDEWREVGSAQPPVDTSEPRGNLIVTRIFEGSGKPVKPGDLVEIRIRSIDGRYKPSHTEAFGFPQTQVLWLWVGQDPTLNSYNEFMNWGSPGSERLRRMLIGKAVRDRLEVRLEPTAQGQIEIPLNGFTVQMRSVPDENHPNPWPEIHFDQKTKVEIEVLNACEAKMFRKTAAIEQFGYILNMFDSAWRTSRRGGLNWSALEAQCPQPVGKIRFEIGPLYFPTAGGPSLYHWRYRYAQLGQEGIGRSFFLLGLRLEVWVVLTFAVGLAIFFWLRRKRNSAN
jgi:hypothetical protein